MSENYLVRFAAPTLAGLKSGNLFTCPYESREALKAEIRSYNSVLAPKGIILTVMRWSADRALIYVFRPGMLQKDLSDRDAVQLLLEAGYQSSSSLSQCLRRLRERLNDRKEEFPHEVGLFLSYPPEDVRGFIEHRDTGCVEVGTWRVYGDVETARIKFRQFKKCTDSYLKRAEMGVPLDRLAVTV